MIRTCRSARGSSLCGCRQKKVGRSDYPLSNVRTEASVRNSVLEGPRLVAAEQAKPIERMQGFPVKPP